MKITIGSFITIILLMLSSPILLGQNQLSKYYLLSEKKFNEGNYVEALKINIQALKLAENQNNCDEIVYANMQVARMQYFLNNRPLALNSFLNTEKIIDSCNIDSLRYKVYHNIGTIYSEIQQLDSSLFYLMKSLTILNKTEKYAELTRTNVVIAALYIERMANPSEGEKYLVQAEKYAALSKDSLLIAFATSKRGGWYFSKKDYKNALVFYDIAFNIYQRHHNTNGILYNLRAIADAKARLKTDDVAESYRYYILLKDSIFSQETAKKMAEYEVQYETEKKEIENNVLHLELLTNQAKIQTRNRTIIGLVVGILMIVTFILWRINALNLKKKQTELTALNELQKEKERISRDLHDNVGGQLSYVLYALDGINEEDSQQRKELTTTINNSIRSVIGSLRETIWAINDEDISLNDFSDKLKVYARNMFRNSSTKIVFSEHLETDYRLKSILGLNLYRICQEIINNAFKYANASELTIIIKSNDKINIKITDNGIGFDLNKQTINSFGLNNIKSRANEVDIKLNVQSEIGKGTSYSLIV